MAPGLQDLPCSWNIRKRSPGACAGLQGSWAIRVGATCAGRVNACCCQLIPTPAALDTSAACLVIHHGSCEHGQRGNPVHPKWRRATTISMSMLPTLLCLAIQHSRVMLTGNVFLILTAPAAMNEPQPSAHETTHASGGAAPPTQSNKHHPRAQ